VTGRAPWDRDVALSRLLAMTPVSCRRHRRMQKRHREGAVALQNPPGDDGSSLRAGRRHFLSAAGEEAAAAAGAEPAVAEAEADAPLADAVALASPPGTTVSSASHLPPLTT
jgi:hypothetical protein